MALVAHQHGKSRVRLGRVWRDGPLHHFAEWSVDTMLQSDMEKAYTEGQNTGMTATDTQKNTIYWLAKQCGERCSPEEFAVTVAKHLVTKYEKVSKATISVERMPWERVVIHNAPHNHGFVGGHSEVRTAKASYTDDGELEVSAGIKNLRILKTTQSGYEGYIQDEYTTLKETKERILATSMTAEWKFADPTADFDAAFGSMKGALLTAFFGPSDEGVYSPSVQHTLYQMGKAALDAVPNVESVHLEMPNIHFLPCAPVMENFEDDVYVATSEPHGIIEATVSRIS